MHPETEETTTTATPPKASFQLQLEALRQAVLDGKPNDRSEADRAHAVLATQLEQAAAFAAYVGI